jgi:hypothetical protein
MPEHAGGRATLAVLGAGPKGLAIAAKRAALPRAGRDVPDLVLIDAAGVAANWSSDAGYTDRRRGCQPGQLARPKSAATARRDTTRQRPTWSEG